MSGAMDTMPKLGRLRELRESKYLSQRMLAQRSGVSRPTIARLEGGDEEARYSTMWKLAEALGVEPGDLVGRDRDREDETPA
jgi:transcriptional regulator with XRE-family HTH domain